jgi:hypothetical protein
LSLLRRLSQRRGGQAEMPVDDQMVYRELGQRSSLR